MALRWFLALTLLSSLFLPVTAAKAQTLDQYGGYTALPVPGGATGYFRVAKLGNRWVFATPLGNAFWMRGVQHPSEGFLTAGVVNTKYGGDAEVWATERNTRMLEWGFNVLGEANSTRGLPIPNRSSVAGSPVKLPFILYLTVIQDAYLSPFSIGLPDYLKDGLRSVPTSTYNGYRGSFIADVYSPLYRQAVEGEYDYWANAIPNFATSPWIVGITTDDADGLWGFKGPAGAVFQPYPNPAWLIAMTKFSYTSAERPGGGTWVDPKFYTKYAWVDFLRARYTTVGALNTAWGTGGFYTSFDDAGGYGVGTGVIDEDGRHTAWVGKMSMADYTISGANATFMQDVNDFLYQYAKTYSSTAVTAIRAKGDTHHLIFGPDAINNYGEKAPDPILRGLADGGFNALIVNYDPRAGYNTMAGNNATYDVTGLPVYVWYSVLANADSEWSGSTPYYGAPNFATQALRGAAYTSDLSNFLAAQGSNGDYYVIGLDFWQLVDTQSAAETANDGLLTHLDNAYDGVQAVVAASTDARGYARGGEAANYGDFLTSVKLAHSNVAGALGLTGGTPPITTSSTTVSITSPTSGSTVKQTVTVSAAASSSATRINLALDGALVGIFSGTTAQYLWDTTTSTNSTHKWAATAYDGSGNSAASSPVSVTVSNVVTNSGTTPPVVSITQPTDGGFVARKTKATIQAIASDDVGVTRVEFYVNGSLKCSVTVGPYACQWQVPAAGPGSANAVYGLQAKAYDAQGNVGSSSIVTVKPR